MKSHTKIAVIGGTGKSGHYIVKELLAQGYKIQMLVRNPEHIKLESPSIEVIYGNVADITSVTQTLKGCTAVISTLGLGSPPSSNDIFAKATANILEVMQQNRLSRYVVTTGLNVDTPNDNKSPETKAATCWMYNNYPESTKNKQQEYELLSKSSLDWTMVRLPLITLTDQTPETIISQKDCPGKSISATALAKFLILQLNETKYINKAPFIADKQ